MKAIVIYSAFHDCYIGKRNPKYHGNLQIPMCFSSKKTAEDYLNKIMDGKKLIKRYESGCLYRDYRNGEYYEFVYDETEFI